MQFRKIYILWEMTLCGWQDVNHRWFWFLQSMAWKGGLVGQKCSFGDLCSSWRARKVQIQQDAVQRQMGSALQFPRVPCCVLEAYINGHNTGTLTPGITINWCEVWTRVWNCQWAEPCKVSAFGAGILLTGGQDSYVTTVSVTECICTLCCPLYVTVSCVCVVLCVMLCHCFVCGCQSIFYIYVVTLDVIKRCVRESEKRYQQPLADAIKKKKERKEQEYLAVAHLLLPASNLLLPSTIYTTWGGKIWHVNAKPLSCLSFAVQNKLQNYTAWYRRCSQ